MPLSAEYDLGPGETSADFVVPLGDTTLLFGIDINSPRCEGVIEFEKGGVTTYLPIPDDRQLDLAGSLSDGMTLRVQVTQVGNPGYPAPTAKAKISLESV